MEDIIKKESEVTKVTNLGDNDCIRATLENGQSVSIKKSDLMPIIKDEIGKLLGNSDALSTFTNVLVNNGQTLGKATIENLASVVSGANTKTWGYSFNVETAIKKTYLISLDGVIIADLNPYSLFGAGLSINAIDHGLQIIISNNACGFRYWLGESYSTWKSF